MSLAKRKQAAMTAQQSVSWLNNQMERKKLKKLLWFWTLILVFAVVTVLWILNAKAE